MTSQLSPEFLADHASWVVEVWCEPALGLEPRDFAIMGMGLSGECGEVMEALQPMFEGRAVDKERIQKELGDVFYNWVRICTAIGVDVVQMWEEAVTGSPGCSLTWTLIELGKHCGRATDTLKKQVRDGTCSRDELLKALAGVARAWAGLCDRLQLDARSILEMNRAKLEDRRARGMLRGSGDNR